MTRFGKFIRRLAEKWKGQFYEGPEPPPRIAEEVRMFHILYPTAEWQQWEEFAVRFAHNCYRDGFVRGYEWQERGWDGPAEDPERLLEEERHNWQLAEQDDRWKKMLEDGSDPNDPLSGLSGAHRTEVYQQLGGVVDRHRILIKTRK